MLTDREFECRVAELLPWQPNATSFDHNVGYTASLFPANVESRRPFDVRGHEVRLEFDARQYHRWAVHPAEVDKVLAQCRRGLLRDLGLRRVKNHSALGN